MKTSVVNRIQKVEVWSKWLELAAVCDIDLVAKYRPSQVASWQTILYKTSQLRHAQEERRRTAEFQEISG